jgi:hypothetical protein
MASLLQESSKGASWEKISGDGDPQAGTDHDNPMGEPSSKYRVLLTRFRKAMVIFVPKGDHEDQTRAPDDFDSAYSHLKLCGLSDLPEH